MESLEREMTYIFFREKQTITLLCNTGSIMPRMISAFNEKNPDYSLRELYASVPEMVEALNTGEAQFALGSPASIWETWTPP